MLREIIRDIYALRVSFLGGRKALEECLRIEDNRERLYEFINEVIREEVDVLQPLRSSFASSSRAVSHYTRSSRASKRRRSSSVKFST
jgi:hypothetical protein